MDDASYALSIVGVPSAFAHVTKLPCRWSPSWPGSSPQRQPVGEVAPQVPGAVGGRSRRPHRSVMRVPVVSGGVVRGSVGVVVGGRPVDLFRAAPSCPFLIRASDAEDHHPTARGYRLIRRDGTFGLPVCQSLRRRFNPRPSVVRRRAGGVAGLTAGRCAGRLLRSCRSRRIAMPRSPSFMPSLRAMSSASIPSPAIRSAASAASRYVMFRFLCRWALPKRSMPCPCSSCSASGRPHLRSWGFDRLGDGVGGGSIAARDFIDFGGFGDLLLEVRSSFRAGASRPLSELRVALLSATRVRQVCAAALLPPSRVTTLVRSGVERTGGIVPICVRSAVASPKRCRVRGRNPRRRRVVGRRIRSAGSLTRGRVRVVERRSTILRSCGLPIFRIVAAHAQHAPLARPLRRVRSRRRRQRRRTGGAVLALQAHGPPDDRPDDRRP